MQFHEKFCLLLQISNSSNLDVSNAVHMDPASVSLYKTGRRSMPKKVATLRLFADYFAGRITEEYQFKAITDLTGASLPTSNTTHSTVTAHLVSDALMAWFRDIDQDPVEQRAKQILHAASHDVVSLAVENIPEDFSHTESDLPDTPCTMIYYGLDGRRRAMAEFIHHVCLMKTPCVIQYFEDDDHSWLIEDRNYLIELKEKLITLFRMGVKIHFYLPPTSSVFFYDILTLLLPAFMSGHIIPFYYPHFRDNLLRGIYCCVENEISLTSTSVAGSCMKNSMNILSTNHQALESANEVFGRLHELHRPAFTQPDLSSSAGFFTPSILTTAGTYYHKCTTLSAMTLPQSLMSDTGTKMYEAIRSLGSSMSLDHLLSIPGNHVYDICTMPGVREIRQGKVRMPIAPTGGGQQYYSIQTFRQHLINILDIMTKYPNYHFLPISWTQASPNASICIREDCVTSLYNVNSGQLINVDEPNVRTVFEDYVRNIVASIPHTGSARYRIMERIRKLISELQD